MNFFDTQCQEPPIRHTLFGLCDDENGQKAYSNVDNPNSWIATVKNDKRKTLVFTAIDKCVIKDGEEVGRGRCDAMLTSDEHLYFVELKNMMANWQTDAVQQLISTIHLFAKHHNVKDFRHRKAFACNRKHRKFVEIDNERNIRFRNENYGFRLDIQADVVVV